MVIGLPRSGTTWAANWLTTDAVFCAHDPLYAHHYEDWNKSIGLHAYRNGFVKAGVSCTGIWRWSDWVNEQDCPKVILHRDFDDVQDSLTELGLPRLDDDAPYQLAQCVGLHAPFEDLFDSTAAAAIWAHLTDSEFNEFRHSALIDYSMQPKFESLAPDLAVTRRLYDELSSI